MNEYVIFDYKSKSNIEFESLPNVSFVIPTHNNERTLERCLNSIRAQRYLKTEIIIVDGYSCDKTLEIARKFADKILLCNGPIGEARQLGIEVSNGQVIGLFDSDIIIPHHEWLLNAVKNFWNVENISTIWPYNIPPPDSSLLARAYSKFTWSIMLDLAMKGKGVWGGGNSLFKKKYVEEVGGISKSINTGEDLYLARKLKDKGYKVIFHEDPLCHDTHRTFREFTQKQVERSSDFKKYGFENLMALSTHELLLEHIEKGFLEPIRGFRKDLRINAIIIPLMVMLRLVIWGFAFGARFMMNVLRGMIEGVR